jgi:predicted dehydrogenase
VKNSTGDTAQVNLKSMDGKSIHANLFTSWVYPKKERTVIITGTQGSFIWEDDNLYINSSHYFEMDEKYVDSFGNRGYDLRDSSSKYIYTESGKTVMEHELNSFLENKPLSRPLILTETWKLIEAIKQH